MTNATTIEVDLSSQQMTVFLANGEMQCYPISSAKNGPGEQLNSECTPRGIHRIAEKIGEGQPENTVFVGTDFGDHVAVVAIYGLVVDVLCKEV